MKKFNLAFVKIFLIWIKYLYLYQIKEYDLGSYGQQILHDLILLNIFKNIIFKGELVYTKKIRILFLSTLFIQLISLILCLYFIRSNVFLILGILLIIFYLTPFYIFLCILLLSPFEYIQKKIIILEAKRKIQKIHPKIIGITGCFGKTTTLSFLSTLLQGDFVSFSPQSGYNTLLGISLEINRKMKDDTEVLLLEIGDYRRGEIEEICKYFPPDIAIITSIGSQHLERFQTIENLILAKGEIIQFSNIDAQIILPMYVYNMKLIPKISSKIYHTVEVSIKDFKNFSTYFSVSGDTSTYHSKLLGEHIIEDLGIAITCAKLLGCTSSQAKTSLLTPVKRRMYPYKQDTNLFIDDTYNIGVESAQSAISFTRFLKERKLVDHAIICTGGIVEQGEISQKRNIEYGRLLDKVMDTIILFSTPFTQDILNGIRHKEKVIQIKNYDQFYADFASHIPDHSVILLQNEIPDAYYFT